MNSHFVKEKRSTFRIVIACILMFPTFCFPMWGAYELFFVPHYWKNRLRLNRLLNQGKVKAHVIRDFEIYGDQIVRIELEIEGRKYSAAIWNDTNLVLNEEIFSNDDYIGLFIGSPLTKYLNRRSVKMIKSLIK